MTDTRNERHQTIIIVGAAGAIGSATAAAFTRDGYTVHGIDQHNIEHSLTLDPDNTTQLADVTNSGLYHHHIADAGNPQQLQHVITTIAEHHPIRHVITIAGGATAENSGHTDTIDVDHDVYLATITDNLTTAWNTAHSTLPHLRTTPGDTTLTFTSSINAHAGIGLPAYSAAKAALSSLARNLAVTEGPHNIRVNAIAPGTVKTPRTEHIWRNNPGHFDTYTATTTLGRTVTCQQLADTYHALADTLTAITGQTLIVDNGQTARWR